MEQHHDVFITSYLVNNLTQKSIFDQKRFIAGLMLTRVVRHLKCPFPCVRMRCVSVCVKKWIPTYLL